jgi:cadmium resistance protein CadD (predicted permease)
MTEVWVLVAISAAAFVSTNLDNLLMLAALLAMTSSRPLPVLAGYLFATVLVVGTALVIGRVGDLIDTRYAGLLGLIPIALGLRGLFGLLRGSAQAGPERKTSAGFWRTAALILPISGDSLAVYVSLLADTSPGLDAVATATLLVSALVFAGTAGLLVSRPGFGSRVGRLGQRLMPWLMIGVGIYVLADTPTDVFAG